MNPENWPEWVWNAYCWLESLIPLICYGIEG